MTLPSTIKAPKLVSLRLMWRALLGASLCVFAMHTAQAQNFTTTAEQAALAKGVAKTGVPEGELISTAPARYVVKRGDTLWDISSLYLRTPWKWPVLWGMNINDIKNPHLIYPGQTLVLTREGGFAKLGFANGADGLAGQRLSPTLIIDQTLSPKLRAEALQTQPISSVKLESLLPFLSQPLVVDEAIISGSGYVLTAPEDRVYAAKNDLFYARGLSDANETRYQLYRPSRPLLDPETKKLLAYEAYYLGTAQVVKAGDPTQLRVTESKEEIARGDRLLPLVREPALNAAPRAPSMPVAARVMSSYNGVEYAGSLMVVTLNKGRQAGLEPGHVLALWRAGVSVVDKEAAPTGFWDRVKGRQTLVRLPDEQYGQALVFRVFNTVAYALVLNSTQPVVVGDVVTQPQ